MDHHVAVGEQTREKFQDVLAELFFLQSGGNMMDFIAWKRKPPPPYHEYVKRTPIEILPHSADEATFVAPTTTGSEIGLLD